MENVPKDILVLIALELDLPNLVNLCRSHKEINRKVCQNDAFWIQKLQRDFPRAVPSTVEGFSELPAKKKYEFSHRIEEYSKSLPYRYP